MKLMKFSPLYFAYTLLLLLMSSCSKTPKETATMLIYGGTIYTVDSTLTKAEAVAIKNNKILYVGSLSGAEQYKTEQTKILDLKGKTMTPGFVEGHGHFMGLGYNELNLDLMNTRSYQDVIDAVAKRVKTIKPGEWIV